MGNPLGDMRDLAWDGAGATATHTELLRALASAAIVPSYLRSTTTATIPTAGSLSAAVDLGRFRIVAIGVPVGWGAADLSFQGSVDNATFANLFDDLGTEITIAASVLQPGRTIIPTGDLDAALRAHRYLKLRSGTAATPVNQSANRVLNLALVAL